MNDELKQVLRELGSFVFIPNIGNAGDGFIAQSTYQLFDELNLSYRVGNLWSRYPGQSIVFAGGGAFVEPYDHMVRFLQSNMNEWRELVVLPHTIRSYPELLQKFGSNAHLFCREKASLSFVRSHAPKARAYLGEDLAFGCDLQDVERSLSLLSFKGINNLLAAPRRTVRLWRRLRRDEDVANSIGNVLSAFRVDVEKTNVDIPATNVDVSETFAGDSMDRLVALHTTYRMMMFLKRFKTVRTNRLHVSIMSARLGLEVDLYDNNYGKNRDVFEQSMLGRYGNVRWCQG